MRQFSLTQLLMGIWLAAILLSLVRSEGCGRRHSMVGCVAFSPDGSRLAVVEYAAREANLSMKFNLTDVSRTISLLDAATGSAEQIVEQVARRGNQGPASNLYSSARTPIAFGPGGNTLLVQEFGGGEVRLYDCRSRTWRRPFAGTGQQSVNLCASADGSLLATAYWNGVVTLWDVRSGKKLHEIPARDAPSVGCPQAAFSADGKTIAAWGPRGVHLWNTADGSPQRVFESVEEPDSLDSMSFSPAQPLLAIGTRGELHLADPATGDRRRVPRGVAAFALAFSPDGKTLAAADHARITFTDVATGESLGEIRVDAGITSLAYSPQGDVLAVGDREGGLTFWDPETRHEVRKLEVPGRVRLPWTLPVATLTLWGAVCYVIWKRRSLGDSSKA